jgi:WD40 repeat protein
VRDRATTRPLAVLEAFGVIARTLRLDGGRLAAGAADGSVAVWDASTWEPLGQWTAHPGEARGLDWHGDTLATGGEDGAVRLWSPSGELRDEADAGLPVTGLAFSPDGARLLAARAGPSGSVLELRP